MCLSVCVSSYTLVFLQYAFNLVCLLLLRPLISAKLTQHGGTKSIYAALYFLPILICAHAVLAGFICTHIYYSLLLEFKCFILSAVFKITVDSLR